MSDQLKTGRRSPHVVVGEWVLLAAISPGAKVLYCLLMAHVNHERGDSISWPSQPRLAQESGCSQPSINRYVAELVALGAIDKHPPLAPGDNCTYVIHETPPNGYDGRLSVTEFKSPDRSHVRLVPALAGTARMAPRPQRRADVGPPTPAPTSPPTRAPRPKVVASANEHPASVGRVIDSVGFSFTPKQRAAVEPAVAATLALGWHERDVARALAGCHEGARYPHRVAITRLSELGTPPPPPPPPAPRCTVDGHRSYPANKCPLCDLANLPDPYGADLHRVDASAHS